MKRVASILLRPFLNLDQYLWERRMERESHERMRVYLSVDDT